MIIPLHEEIFHLAESEDSIVLEKLLAPPFDILIRLHNKWEFQTMMKRFGFDVPEAHLCRNVEDVRNLDLSREWAVKPVYGRASSKVHHLKPGKPFTEDIAMSTTTIITLLRSGCQASDIAAMVLFGMVEPKRRASIQSWTRLTVARPSTSSSNTMIESTNTLRSSLLSFQRWPRSWPLTSSKLVTDWWLWNVIPGRPVVSTYGAIHLPSHGL